MREAALCTAWVSNCMCCPWEARVQAATCTVCRCLNRSLRQPLTPPVPLPPPLNLSPPNPLPRRAAGQPLEHQGYGAGSGGCAVHERGGAAGAAQTKLHARGHPHRAGGGEGGWGVPRAICGCGAASREEGVAGVLIHLPPSIVPALPLPSPTSLGPGRTPNAPTPPHAQSLNSWSS
jgi:hypothetical protein